MKALITGATGTLGSVLADAVRLRGGQVVGWDRAIAPPGDWEASRRLVESVSPTILLHTALPSQPSGMENEGWVVNEKWTADIAALGRDLNIPFVYTSTVMVYTSRVAGPLTPDMEPDETEGYGHSKRLGEINACAANANARIARLGWQIGTSETGNHMVAHLSRQHAESGEIRASTKWLPATSFLEDTAEAILNIANMPPGIYHVGANTRWSFFEIVQALNHRLGAGWNITPTEDFLCDQRLIDTRLNVGPLEARLPWLLQQCAD